MTPCGERSEKTWNSCEKALVAFYKTLTRPPVSQRDDSSMVGTSSRRMDYFGDSAIRERQELRRAHAHPPLVFLSTSSCVRASSSKRKTYYCSFVLDFSVSIVTPLQRSCYYSKVRSRSSLVMNCHHVVMIFHPILTVNYSSRFFTLFLTVNYSSWFFIQN